MPILGDMLVAARRSSGEFNAWFRAADAGLAAEIERAAAASGLGIAGYARMAIADFSRLASEEDWASLVSKLRDGEDPGRTLLVGMVHWRLTAAGCAKHANLALHQHEEEDHGERARHAD